MGRLSRPAGPGTTCHAALSPLKEPWNATLAPRNAWHPTQKASKGPKAAAALTAAGARQA